MKQHTNKSSGFGILEVFIAAVILAIISGGILGLHKIAVSSSSLSGDKAVAYNLAQEGIEKLRYSRDNGWKQGTGWVPPLPPDEQIPFGGRTYNRSYSLQADVIPDLNNSGDSDIEVNYRRVVVTVSWEDKGATQSARAATYLTNWRLY